MWASLISGLIQGTNDLIFGSINAYQQHKLLDFQQNAFDEQMAFNKEQAQWQQNFAEEQASIHDPRKAFQTAKDSAVEAGFSPLAALGSGIHGSPVSAPSMPSAPQQPHMTAPQLPLGQFADIAGVLLQNRALDITEAKNLSDAEMAKTKLMSDRQTAVDQMANQMNVVRAQLDASAEAQDKQIATQKFLDVQNTTRLLMQQRHSDLETTRKAFASQGINTYVEADSKKREENNIIFIQKWTELLEYATENSAFTETTSTSTIEDKTKGGLNASLGTEDLPLHVSAGTNVDGTKRSTLQKSTGNQRTFEEEKRKFFAEYRYALSPSGY
ncbi:DNA pilot protein [Tortoise microvirus 80]|nr:DNA pilot protein [Tortoise microvirus 80]